jgi:phosphohistidine phosphatase SixA
VDHDRQLVTVGSAASGRHAAAEPTTDGTPQDGEGHMEPSGIDEAEPATEELPSTGPESAEPESAAQDSEEPRAEGTGEAPGQDEVTETDMTETKKEN